MRGNDEENKATFYLGEFLFDDQFIDRHNTICQFFNDIFTTNIGTFLQKYLTNKPYETELLPISFSYGGKVISIESVGYYKFIEFFIRKAAHFFTYFFLGAFLSLGLATYVKRMWIVILSSLILAGGYAAFDEFHQMLTGDRTPLIQDVILDSIGALCGILLAVSCYYIFQKTRTKK